MITPASFYRELLSIAPEGSMGWVTIFDEPPSSNDRHWAGRRCAPDAIPAMNGSNAYYSVAAFPSDARARTKATMLGTCVVLLDDIGQKADPELPLKLFGEPSYKIQTSANSQQWGYCLDRLATDDEISPIHKRLMELHLSDRNGLNSVRYGRFPAGVNNKPEYGEPFAVRAVEMNLERRFEIEMFAAALEAVPREQKAKAKKGEEDDFEALAAAIEAGDDYHGPLTTLAAKYTAAGYPARDIVSILKSHMLSSEDRSARWKSRYDDIERTVNTAAKFRPPEREDTIAVRVGTQVESVNAIIEVLSRRGIAASIFVRGGMLVRPYLVSRLGFNDEPVASLEMTSLDSTALQYELGGLIAFEKRDRQGRARRVDCPPRFAQTVLAIPHRWEQLPRLDVIVSSPLYLGNGRLLSAPGYNAEKRAWLAVPAGVVSKERPGKEDALEAGRRIEAYIEEFQFATDVDRAVMLAAAIGAVLRPSLPACPAVAFDAPEFGSGKTTAAKLVHIIGFGRLPAVMNFVADADEMRKVIDAAQIEGRQSLVFDNVPPNVKWTHDSLAQVLTERERQARELGASRTHTVPCNQFVEATGNNINIGEDLTRRSVVCRLDPMGDPTARKFKRPNLLFEVQQNRVAILSDIFTIVAAYEAAGAPRDIDPLVGYEEWCRWVQRPLVWLGYADPVLSTRELQSEDEDRASLETIVALWHAAHGSDWVTVKTLTTYTNVLRGASELIEEFQAGIGADREGKVDKAKLGYWLRKNKERWTRSGMRIERKSHDGASNRSAQWRVARRGGIRGIGGDSKPTLHTNLDTNNGYRLKDTPESPLSPTEEKDDDEM